MMTPKNLVDQCVIERAPTARDSSGQPVPDWNNATVMYGGPCRYWKQKETVALDDQSFQVRTVHRLMVPGEIEVEAGEKAEGEQYRVARINTAQGSTLGPFDVSPPVHYRRNGRGIVKFTALDLEVID